MVVQAIESSEGGDFYDERDSNFSASFYGPLYEEKPPPPPPKPEVKVIKDGYFYVKETHKHEHVFDASADRIRYFLLTKPDAAGRICLHLACQFGDKDFSTMIVYEADLLGFGSDVIDYRDRFGLSPLYMLCEQGYRKQNNYEDQEQEALNWGLQKVIANEMFLDRENEGLEEDERPEDPAALAAEMEDLERGALEEYEQYRERLTKTKVELLLQEGLFYTTRKPMLLMLDGECKKPSRNYVVKMLIEFGANPNVQSPEVLHTPLHWLAYWGDHRAVKQVLELNRLDFIQVDSCCVDKNKFLNENGAFNNFLTRNGQTPADIAGDLHNYRCLKAIIDYFIDKEEQNIRNAFVTPAIVEKFEKKRFAQQRTKQIEISKHDTAPEYVKLAFIKSNEFTPQQRSYLHLAYWAISLANLDERVPEDQDYGKYEIYMKKFVYIFVLDLGISPFIKCYQEKSLVQACVIARRNDFLRELLSHKYEMLTKSDFKDFVKSCKSKDRKGNNIFHEIFMLPQESRNRFLETIYSEEY